MTNDPSDPGARQALFREVNLQIRRLAERVDGHTVRRWPFVCECGRGACNEPVLLTLAAFDAVPMHEALVAPGHARRQPNAA
jgi:hypothetical protein